MASKAVNNVDRGRTVWTPEMDRYFIDLMLEQLNKGIRFDDPLFSKRAWKEMNSLFNVKFKFKYHKDVLKNRYKSMRNIHKTVKSLLDHEGFFWDDLRQMVSAENSVWEEYLKLHPEARAYRIKSIPYFNDLNIIFRKTSPEQKGEELLESSRCGENKTVMVENSSEEVAGDIVEFPGDENKNVKMPCGLNDTTQTIPSTKGNEVGSRTRTHWQPAMDQLFIELVLENIKKGNQIEGTFHKQVWEEMVGLFNAKFGINHSVEILKNRYKTLRRLHNLIKNLLDKEGFAWDDTRQMVIADDTVWQDYVKTHRDARQFMTRPIPHYKDLCVIFGDSSPNETHCFSIHDFEMQNEGQSKDSHSADQSGSCQDEIGDLLESTHVGLSPSITNSRKKRQCESSSDSDCVKKSPRTNEKLVPDLENCEDRNSVTVSIEKVVAAIQALPDMDDDLILDACDFLEDDFRAKRFMALDVKLRKKWLLRKLRP